jgi:hypothetical protein
LTLKNPSAILTEVETHQAEAEEVEIIREVEVEAAAEVEAYPPVPTEP